MKLTYLSLALLLSSTPSLAAICLGSCEETSHGKVCTFELKVNLFASELGYFMVTGCEGIMPTLGIEKGVTYVFDQGDESNYYHPLGLAYYPDGAHDDVDELEPVIVPPGSSSDCEADAMCPAPMYRKGNQYLGAYSNNEAIAPLQGSDNFGLDDYEPEFFLDFLTWKTAGKYEVALKFDVDDFTQDIFYFCHIHQFITGRIKFIDEKGDVLQEENKPDIPYEYESPSEFDESCGTFGLNSFVLPHKECPSTFVCDKPEGAVGDFVSCLDAMNCAMTVGMTTNANKNSAIALFNHQMTPHHQNAVNMCKALLKSGEVQCDDIEDEDHPHCQMVHLCYVIINNQNFQIQTMRGILESLDYDEEDDCKIPIKSKRLKNNKKKKDGKMRT
mmetsp:Transcript_21686/g.32494  ORF Transcript_21686/g.32494 Transcript_21686/m.32494 type:complete len:387 (+) Transcript_21686:40-1200(+)